MGYFKEVRLQGSERVVNVYAGIDSQKLESDLDALMIQQGYVHKGKGVYEKGNRVLRLMLGAFYKYYKFQVSLDASNSEEILVGISKMSSGMSGGVIGMNQMKKELANLGQILQSI